MMSNARVRLEDPVEQARAIINGLAAAKPGDISIREELAPYPKLAQVIFRGAPLRGMDLRGQDLRDFDFTGANLIDARLDDALIAGARFDQARVDIRQFASAWDWTAHLEGWSAPAGERGLHVVAGDRFTLAPFAPEMRILPSGLTWDKERPDAMTDDEWQALRTARLALSITPVLRWQHGYMRNPHASAREATTNLGRRPAQLDIESARAYLGRLRRKVVADYRVPSLGLLRLLAEAPGGANREIVAETTADGARNPRPPESPERLGRGRTNAFGIQDLIGNTREFAADPRRGAMHDGWPDTTLAIGGAFWQPRSRAANFREPIAAGANPGLLEHGLRVILIFPDTARGNIQR